ncbi:hypothetical protein K7X08_008432 [Anisodus acutangulus]|uniref:Uncharacterized protein n=1 Tax=Anisodus acutangulus TaxID=402998 RepID=A0A9Q1MR98_9SOLA|nr:hypothetical protein K7X08_008432 [Anisodus acutangulus]
MIVQCRSQSLSAGKQLHRFYLIQITLTYHGEVTIGRKRSVVARRAWNVLRLALLLSRKGVIFKNRHLVDLRLLPKYIKSLHHSNDYGYGVGRGALHYGEGEFSFDDTPIIHVKMHRPASLRFKMPNIPCIKPQVEFDNDCERDDEMYSDNNDDAPRKSFLSTEDDYLSCEVS